MAETNENSSFGGRPDMTEFEADYAAKPQYTVTAQEFSTSIRQGTILTGVLTVASAGFYEAGSQIPTSPGVLWAAKLILMGSGVITFGIAANMFRADVRDHRKYRAEVDKFNTQAR